VQRLLCSLDGQACVSAALRAAISVATQFDATLDVLQIMDTHEGQRQPKYISFADHSLRLMRTLDSYQQFEQMVQTAGSAIRVATHQADGPTSSAILRRGQRANYDLVVLDGSQGKELCGRRSSNVSEIAEADAFRSILTVCQSDPALEFKRILLPIDFTDVSSAAVEWAAAFSRRYGGFVQVLHVASPRALQIAQSDPANVRAATAEFGLSAIEASLRQHGLVTSSSSRVHEDAGTAILEEYASGAFDLIVMGTHDLSRQSGESKPGTVAHLRQYGEVSLLSIRMDTPNGEFVQGEPAEMMAEHLGAEMDSTGTSD
jgi:nucleotide-binding universal stress UspA family protein